MIRRLHTVTEADVDGLTTLLVDCVDGGASVSFMHPLDGAHAARFWRQVAAGVEAGERALLVAEDDHGIAGTVQLVLSQPDNQPHRADLAKMLVHRRARRQGLGAALMQAAEQLGRQPGRDILFAGINTSREAMQAVLDGRLTALAGGHFLAGAWALLMLHDYHHGFDFAPEGLEQEQPMFMLFGKAEARRYLARFGEGMPALDFRPYSRRYSASPQRPKVQNLLLGPQ